jgi:hypothetical protein
MKGIPVILVAVWLALPQGFSQLAYMEKDSQTLASVKLPPAVRKNIERVVFDFVDVPPDQRHAIATQIPFDRVRLGPRTRWVWQSMAPNDFCGSHAKCEYWLFDPTTGASLVTMLSARSLTCWKRGITGGVTSRPAAMIAFVKT